MKRIHVQLTEAERLRVNRFRRTGRHAAREVNRAHILAGLDAGLSVVELQRVLGVTRVSVWRTASAYRTHGLDKALEDAR